MPQSISTPTPSSPTPALGEVRVTEGAWTSCHLPNPPDADIHLRQKRSNSVNIDGRPLNQSPAQEEIIQDEASDSNSEFSDEVLPRLFDVDSDLCTLKEKDEEQVSSGEQGNTRSVLLQAFNEVEREESPFFGRAGGGERGFDVWRDQY